MTAWTRQELDAIGGADELDISVRRPDGTAASPVPIWVVPVGDSLYVRSYPGIGGSWYRHARSTEHAHALAAQVGVAGDRYNAAHMALIDRSAPRTAPTEETT